MILATKVHEIMTKNVVKISITDTITDIEHTFRINHLRHAPVCEGERVVGMISLLDLRHSLPIVDRDDMEYVEGPNLIASQIMVADPITLQSSQPIREAALLFSDNEFHAVPVLDGEHIAGIISTTDLIRFMMESIDELETSMAE
ncbi:MAG: CBS domain-containing protein [Bacteroidia bacterium]|nr:CBS domain-containing protein [Bacteroidia bacterium]